MSLHSHVSQLNAYGSRLSDLVARLRYCADSTTGPRPRADSPHPSAPSALEKTVADLDSKFTHMANQYNEVIDQLAQEVERLEEQLLDRDAKLGVTTAVPRGY